MNEVQAMKTSDSEKSLGFSALNLRCETLRVSFGERILSFRGFWHHRRNKRNGEGAWARAQVALQIAASSRRTTFGKSSRNLDEVLEFHPRPRASALAKWAPKGSFYGRRAASFGSQSAARRRSGSDRSLCRLAPWSEAAWRRVGAGFQVKRKERKKLRKSALKSLKQLARVNLCASPSGRVRPDRKIA